MKFPLLKLTDMSHYLQIYPTKYYNIYTRLQFRHVWMYNKYFIKCVSIYVISMNDVILFPERENKYFTFEVLYHIMINEIKH